MTKLLVTFLVSSALAGVCAGAVAVYVLGDIDPKFRDSLSSAFELELIAAAGIVPLTALSGVRDAHGRASPSSSAQ